MSRGSPRSPVLAGAAALAAVVVLVLGAASHGFEASLAEVPTATPTPTASGNSAPQTRGHPLRTSVVAFLPDRADGSVAVVVRIENPDARRAARNVLIVTYLVDRAGTVVGRSTTAGTDPLRVRVPYVGPGQSVLFVNDTIAAGPVPSAARASATGTFSAPRSAGVAVRSARLRHSAFGWIATATLQDRPAAGPPRNVLVEAVVRRNGRIVAAGTEIASVPRDDVVDIFLTGDAAGGTPSVWIAGP